MDELMKQISNDLVDAGFIMSLLDNEGDDRELIARIRGDGVSGKEHIEIVFGILGEQESGYFLDPPASNGQLLLIGYGISIP